LQTVVQFIFFYASTDVTNCSWLDEVLLPCAEINWTVRIRISKQRVDFIKKRLDFKYNRFCKEKENAKN
jgi:hypothetical protein